MILKRKIFCLSVLALCLFLNACGDSKPQPKQKTKTEQKKSAPAPKKKAKKVSRITDSEEGSLKVKITTEKEQESPLPQVKQKKGALTILSKEEAKLTEPTTPRPVKLRAFLQSLRTPRPRNSFAAKFAAQSGGRVIRWFPQRSEQGTNRIPCGCISADESIILLAETIGEAPGPYGTRLVLIDTHSWTVAAVYHLLKSNVHSVVLTENNSCVLLSRGQEQLKTRDEIQLFDFSTGEIMDVFAEPDFQQIFAGRKNSVFVTGRKNSAKEKLITVYDCRKAVSKCRELNSSNISPVLVQSYDKKEMLAAGNYSLEHFRLSDLRKETETPLPADFETADILPLHEKGYILAPPTEARMSPVKITAQEVTPFGQNAAGKLVRSPDKKPLSFYCLMSRKGRITQFTSESLEEIRFVDPEDARPRTTGNPQMIFMLKHCPQALVVLDEYGNFYLLFQNDQLGRRWMKEILFSPGPKMSK